MPCPRKGCRVPRLLRPTCDGVQAPCRAPGRPSIHIPEERSMAESGMVTGLFRDRDSAERAYQSISDRGYSRDDVNLVMSDDTRKRHFGAGTDGRETELGTKAAEGAGIGGGVGGRPGAVGAGSARGGAGPA